MTGDYEGLLLPPAPIPPLFLLYAVGSRVTVKCAASNKLFSFFHAHDIATHQKQRFKRLFHSHTLRRDYGQHETAYNLVP